MLYHLTPASRFEGLTLQNIEAFSVLIVDPVGLKRATDGQADISEFQSYLKKQGCGFHVGPKRGGAGPDQAVAAKISFYYCPDLSTDDDILNESRAGAYDAVIAAAKSIPAAADFPFGGVRIGSGTGNMKSLSWGGPDGRGGLAPLMNTPGINARATAQMVFKAILRVAPDLPFEELHTLCVEGRFDSRTDVSCFPTSKLEGQRIAILGFGNIGRQVARLAQSFAMNVSVYGRQKDRIWIEAEGFEYAKTPLEAGKRADFLSIHLGVGPRMPDTGRNQNDGIVSAEVMRLMNAGATLINFDRGELVDTHPLDDFLATGQIKQIFVDADIYSRDAGGCPSGPLAPYRRLAQRFPNNVMLLPHVAADTDHSSRVAGACMAAGQIIEALTKRRVSNRVGDLPLGYLDGGKSPIPGVGATTVAQVKKVVGDQQWRNELDRLNGLLNDGLRRLKSDNCTIADVQQIALATTLLSRLLRDSGLYGPITS